MSTTETTVRTPNLEAPVISAADAARYIGGFDEKTLANWRHLGIGPKFIRMGKVGGRIRYRRTDLDKWLASHVEG